MTDFQTKIFKHLSVLIGDQYTLVDEVAQILNTSKSNAYKKISSEVKLSLREVEVLCEKYKLPLTSFTKRQSEHVFH